MRAVLFSLGFTSVVPYFVLMALFMLTAGAIQRVIPFYRRALAQEKADRNHNLQLDGMRGVLALSVFFTHAETVHFWTAGVPWGTGPSVFYKHLGTVAVGLFFLTTGFLFWTKAQKGGVGRLHVYFAHRIRRLVPAYFFSVSLIFLVVMWETHFRLAVPLPNLLRSVLGYLSFNLLGTPPLNGFGLATWINGGVTWSLAVEWMFYFALPLLALAARGTRRQLLVPALSILLYYLQPLLRRHVPAPGLGMLMYFNHYLLTYFLIGMLISYIKLRYRSIEFLRTPLATAFAICMLALVLFSDSPRLEPFIGLALGVPMLLVVFGNSFFGLLRQRSLVLLGQISYSIYLLHAIVLYVVKALLDRTGHNPMQPWSFWGLTAVEGVFVVALAAFSFRFFEAPFVQGYGFPGGKAADQKAAHQQPVVQEMA